MIKPSLFNKKYLKLKNIKLLKNINELKINSIISLEDKKNFSNQRKFFVGNHRELLGGEFLRTSKIFFSSSDILFSRIWETASGRLIRNLVFYHDFPKKVFLTIDFDFLVILTKKSILIYNFFNGIILHTVSFEAKFPINFQIIKEFPLILILGKNDKLFILNYKKGYFIKKPLSIGNSFFPNGNNKGCLFYCLKNNKSLSLHDFLKRTYLKFKFPENNFWYPKNIKFEKFIFTNQFKNINYTSFLYISNTIIYLWDFYSKLVVLN